MPSNSSRLTCELFSERARFDYFLREDYQVAVRTSYLSRAGPPHRTEPTERRVSVIVPAHNAAKTLRKTLESLLQQTVPDWEAIIIDDGSTDQTGAVAREIAASDARIRLVSQAQKGPGAARNRGLSLAQNPWLLFLDADDWIAPDYLDRMLEACRANPRVDGVLCDFAYAREDGSVIRVVRSSTLVDDLFAHLARSCVLAIHGCLFRRRLLENAGAFDPSLRTCEDWDLWQRVSRTGARFASVGEVLAYYRLRFSSLTTGALRLLSDGLKVIERGHSFDPRVKHPDPLHRNGRPAGGQPAAQFAFACYCGGILLAQGDDPAKVFEQAPGIAGAGVHPVQLAEGISNGFLHGRAAAPSQQAELWAGLGERGEAFIRLIEARSGAPLLARRLERVLERTMLRHAEGIAPVGIGRSCSRLIDVERKLPDVGVAPGVEICQFRLVYGGESIGIVELPVCDGKVAAYVLEDAIVERFAWDILRVYLAREVYPGLRVETEVKGMFIWRGEVLLAAGIADPLRLHDTIGWTVFLQEFWGEPELAGDAFYAAAGSEAKEGPSEDAPSSVFPLRSGEPLPRIKTNQPELSIVLFVGASPMGVVIVPARDGLIRPGELRSAVTTQTGFELCRAAVREGLLGRPVAGEGTLQERLRATASLRKGDVERWDNQSLQAYGTSLVRERVGTRDPLCILARRYQSFFGMSFSRRAALPAKTQSLICEAADALGETVLRVPGESGLSPGQVLYAPEVMVPDSKGDRPFQEVGPADRSSPASAEPVNRFELLFRIRPDPWGYTSAYEAAKYEQTLRLIPKRWYRHALELACAEGHFTAQLARRVRRLVAADISPTALRRAAARCARLSHVEFRVLDMAKDQLGGPYDLIVCSEVLYFMGDEARLRAVLAKIARALKPGGYFVTAHANLVVDDPGEPGFDWDEPFGAKRIGELTSALETMRMVEELSVPMYRIQRFQKAGGVMGWLGHRPPKRFQAPQPAPLPPAVARHALWHGGKVAPGAGRRPRNTTNVPMLLYHQVSAYGPEKLAPYRVSPEAFEEQLDCLRAAGFYSISLAQWRWAAMTRRPLEGRPCHISFDDGYEDFLAAAWPRVKRYGFSASVYIVSDHVGKSSAWDSRFGEPQPLMGWKDLRRLQEEGVEFGSHTATHRPLTALPPEEVFREVLRSRMTLQKELQRPVEAFAYPHGDWDPAVRHWVGASGYLCALTCQPGAARFHDDLLALPRVEITGSDGLEQFAAKVGL